MLVLIYIVKIKNNLLGVIERHKCTVVVQGLENINTTVIFLKML